MKFITVQPCRGGLSKIRIVGADVMLDKPFDSWALNNGKRLLFAHNRMHKLMNTHYIMGTFEQGAVYAYDYAEACNIITSHIGLNDEKAYIALQAQEVPQKSNVDRSYLAWFTLGKVCELLIIIAWGIVKVVAFLTVIPFLIYWMNKHK